jgi:dihydrofolate reductase
MTRVVVDITMSLDGYVTGPSPGLDQGLGIGGEPLHNWAIDHKSAVDEQILASGYAATGVVIMGRRTFDIIDGPHGWNDDMGYGAERDQSAPPPTVVVTHTIPENPRHTAGFTFVTNGIASALAAARELAGDKDIVIMGGADIADQFLRQGLVDELRLHLAPLVLGSGTQLLRDLGWIELNQGEVVSTSHVTHLTYSVENTR